MVSQYHEFKQLVELESELRIQIKKKILHIFSHLIMKMNWMIKKYHN
jgi:hypothetical protein